MFSNWKSLAVNGIQMKSLKTSDGVYLFKKNEDILNDALKFTAVDAGAVVQLKCIGSDLKSQVFQTSTDGQNWTDHSFDIYGMLVNSGTSTEFVLPNIGDKIYFKAKTDNTGITREDFSNYLQFTTILSSKLVDVSGNVMSLLSPEFKNLKQVNSYQFCKLFLQNKSIRGCDKLILPVETLTTYCYSHMFSGCTSLTSAPELPATTLADYCYHEMFSGCTSLETTPTLPATTLATYCYSYMFQGCSSLTSAHALHAETLANGCYASMFQDCKKLTSAPELPAETLADSCYASMFRGCTSLTSATELPAKILVYGCYSWMFQGCSSLTSAPALPAETLAYGCYLSMFMNCSNLKINENGGFGVKFLELPADTESKTKWNFDMFTGTSGTFKGEPQIGKSYYWYTDEDIHNT